MTINEEFIVANDTFGQILSERGFSFRVTVMGLILFISGYLMSYLFLRER